MRTAGRNYVKLSGKFIRPSCQNRNENRLSTRPFGSN